MAIKPPRFVVSKPSTNYKITLPAGEALSTRYNLKFLLPFDGSTRAVGYNATPDATTTGILYGRGDNAKFDRSGGLFGSLTNLITNPSFETNTTGWVCPGTASLTRTTTTSFDRSYSAAYAYTSGTSGFYFENFSFSPSTTYTYTIRIKKGNGEALTTSSFDCWIDYGIASGNSAFDSVTHEYNGWHKCRKTFTSAGSITDSEIGLGNVDDSSLYVDAATLTATAYEVPYFDGASGTGFAWSGGADSSTSTKADAILFYTTPTYTGSSRSIGFWLKAEQVGAGTILDFTSGTSDRISLVSGKLTFYVNNSSVFAASNTATAETWEHWAITYSGSSAKLYKNGAVLDTAIGAFPTLGTGLRIGQTVVPDDRLNGFLDDLFFTDVTLSDDQILAIYNSTRPVESVTEFPRSRPIQLKI
jgi:hypothetical protein